MLKQSIICVNDLRTFIYYVIGHNLPASYWAYTVKNYLHVNKQKS